MEMKCARKSTSKKTKEMFGKRVLRVVDDLKLIKECGIEERKRKYEKYLEENYEFSIYKLEKIKKCEESVKMLEEVIGINESSVVGIRSKLLEEKNELEEKISKQKSNKEDRRVKNNRQ